MIKRFLNWLRGSSDKNRTYREYIDEVAEDLDKETAKKIYEESNVTPRWKR